MSLGLARLDNSGRFGGPGAALTCWVPGYLGRLGAQVGAESQRAYKGVGWGWRRRLWVGWFV